MPLLSVYRTPASTASREAKSSASRSIRSANFKRSFARAGPGVFFHTLKPIVADSTALLTSSGDAAEMVPRDSPVEGFSTARDVVEGTNSLWMKRPVGTSFPGIIF